jgi:hypothetical protein
MIKWGSARRFKLPQNFEGADFKPGSWADVCAIWFWGVNLLTTILLPMRSQTS